MAERRSHQRFHTSIPIKYGIQETEWPQVCWIGYGVLKNVSFSGVYFISSDTPPLEQDQIRDVTIMSAEGHLDFSKIVHISAKGRVVRLESPNTEPHDVGIALEFLTGPTISDSRINS